MQFTADEYYRASVERMQQAIQIYESGNSYALAMYCGGLAVESLLRAFRWTTPATFEGRHDLSDLLRASGLLEINDKYLQQRQVSERVAYEESLRFRAAMSDVNSLWRNNLRLASEASLKAFLRRTQRLRGVKGNPLKKNARDLINAAQMVIDRGVTLWTSGRRS